MQIGALSPATEHRRGFPADASPSGCSPHGVDGSRGGTLAAHTISTARLVRDLDPRSGYRAYEACTMMSLRKSLRRGSVWLDHSLSFRERDQMLIPPAQWVVQRDEQVELLGMPKSAAEFLEPLLANLVAGMSAVAEAQRRCKVEIGADGMLHLPAMTAPEVQSEPVRTRETELLRLAASIRSGRISATLALQRFGSAAQGDPLHRAAEHLGRLLRHPWNTRHAGQWRES